MARDYRRVVRDFFRDEIVSNILKRLAEEGVATGKQSRGDSQPQAREVAGKPEDGLTRAFDSPSVWCMRILTQRKRRRRPIF